MVTNLKYVKLPCPTCEFPHDFKRCTWWERENGYYLGVYSTDDMKSRKECKQTLLYGVADSGDVAMKFYPITQDSI